MVENKEQYLISLLKFENNLEDSYNNNYVTVAKPKIQDTSSLLLNGKSLFNTAVYFDSYAYLYLKDPMVIGNKDFTISFYMYPIQYEFPRTNYNLPVFSLHKNEDNFINLLYHIVDDTHCNMEFVYNNEIYTFNTVTPLLNNWHHFAICYSNKNIILYIDGIKVKKEIKYYFSGKYTVYIGSIYNKENIKNYIGYLRDFAIYNNISLWDSNVIETFVEFPVTVNTLSKRIVEWTRKMIMVPIG